MILEMIREKQLFVARSKSLGPGGYRISLGTKTKIDHLILKPCNCEFLQALGLTHYTEACYFSAQFGDN